MKNNNEPLIKFEGKIYRLLKEKNGYITASCLTSNEIIKIKPWEDVEPVKNLRPIDYALYLRISAPAVTKKISKGQVKVVLVDGKRMIEIDE